MSASGSLQPRQLRMFMPSFDEYEDGYEVQGGRMAGGGWSGTPYWRRRPKT